ncbi:MAG TPA: 4Fe-4S dicluster domain-containing protein [bacterium]|nr:heterodisulfide reductase [Candidatus Omnitrophota bacterium]HOJ61581.1 4Fe-4S dicluster domain-containing protein [bacterium]HOL95103.1 4Fe-4S dicluster domain-containing protein [bacterium]HPP00407.1 4Fe-4S dicluster domain-containing protein [bacterium]
MITRTIKYESELHPEFAREVADQALGKTFTDCIQCGTCSSTCPLTLYMDYTPRRLIAMTREGFKEEVLQSFTIWLCASCYSCSVDCPKEVDITSVMYALKQRAIEEKVYPSRFPIPNLAYEFFRFILKYGRSNEAWLIFRMYLRTNPLKMFKHYRVGWRLWRTGRFDLRCDSIANRKDLENLFAALREN